MTAACKIMENFRCILQKQSSFSLQDRKLLASFCYGFFCKTFIEYLFWNKKISMRVIHYYMQSKIRRWLFIYYFHRFFIDFQKTSYRAIFYYYVDLGLLKEF